MIKWHIKYMLSAIIDIMPFKHFIHCKLQNISGNDQLDEQEMLSRAVELYSLIFKNISAVENKKIIEVGTGWFPYMPVVAYIYGAKRITTVDLNPWLTNDTLRKTICSVLDNKDELINEIGVETELIHQRIAELKSIYEKNLNLDSTLSELNIIYYSNYDLRNMTVDDDANFDIVISSNVLEHVESGVLAEIHSHLYKITSENGIAVHRFNPADHYAYLSGSNITFLTISNLIWKLYREGGIAYHNRLRTVEHANLAKNSKWGIKFWADAIDQKAKNALKDKQLVVQNSYKDMTEDEICAFYSWFVLDKNESQVKQPVLVKWVSELL